MGTGVPYANVGLTPTPMMLGGIMHDLELFHFMPREMPYVACEKALVFAD